MAPSEIPPVVICDAGPLIHLDELRCLDLLNEFPEILVPAVVWAEVQHHRPAALRHRRVVLTQIMDIPEPNAALAAILTVRPLDPGEEQALRLMARVRGATLLTDDATARVVAENMRYPVYGTLGVMPFGERRGRRSKRQLLNLLRAVPRRSTLHASKRLLSGLIADVEARDD